jgi:cell division protein FtsW
MQTTAPSTPFISLETVWKKFPAWVLVGLSMFLCILGLLMLHTIGRSNAVAGESIFYKQLIWVAFAMVAFVAAVSVDLEWLKKWSFLLALLGVVVLILVLIPGIGSKINGARRWIPVGPMNIQVSDFAKISFLLIMAWYLSSHRRYRDQFWRGYVVPGLMIGIPFCLIMLQPDFGTAFVYALVGGTLMFLAGVRMFFLIPTGLLGLGAFGLAVLHDPVRWQRIVSFLNIEANRNDGAYQLYQGMIGFGAGGLSGVGLGNGRQQLAFLPEAHTDFIFPIIGEELGFGMTSLVLLAFAVLFCVSWLQMNKAPGLYPYLLGIGALLFVVFQALINMGVSTGCLPTKGMSLPLISYGGSNLVVTALLLGIVVNGCLRWEGKASLKAREIED